MNTSTRAAAASSPLAFRMWAVPLLLVGCLAWSYWPTLAELRRLWTTSDDYSAGQLVPLVALYLVWRTRLRLFRHEVRPDWWGLGLIALAQALRFAGVYYAYGSAERLSIVLNISGMVLLVGGSGLWRASWWIQAFLLLMVPLPTRVQDLISLPLQEWASGIGVFGLELLGFYVSREGNVLWLNGNSPVMVGEACSGLRMLTAFIFTAAVLGFLITRPPWLKALILLGSIPIAVVVNGLRVLATSVFLSHAQALDTQESFHTLAGILMMPLAVLLLLTELKLLDMLRQAFTAQRDSPPSGEATSTGSRVASARLVPPTVPSRSSR